MTTSRALMIAFLVVLCAGTMAFAAGPNPDCPDADGDGICNCQDPDYTPPGRGGDRVRNRIHDQVSPWAPTRTRARTNAFGPRFGF